jgi:hypothetical protein
MPLKAEAAKPEAIYWSRCPVLELLLDRLTFVLLDELALDCEVLDELLRLTAVLLELSLDRLIAVELLVDRLAAVLLELLDTLRCVLELLLDSNCPMVPPGAEPSRLMKL